MATEFDSLEQDERLALLQWLNERYEVMRDALSTRAAIVLSADALLIAGVTSLLGSMFTIDQYSDETKVVFGISGLTIMLLVLSMLSATIGIANIGRTSRELFGRDMPKRLFVQMTDTYNSFSGYEQFEEGWKASTKESIERHLLANLWTATLQSRQRYGFLRFSILLLVVSTIPFTILVLCLLLTVFSR